ncbi:heterokaryon incompatibility protein-domain-containing protein [Xylaria cubensis]|nr:heterokaryon incompatibility protein-domain-containing protein [Xylaria cubensis]
MRLLQRETDGKYKLVEFFGKIPPPYAILSHTWGADDEEVTLWDILNDKVKKKSGYKKIRFCAEQAKKDELQFFWVDSCCIDKSSSAELTEAINSMFDWYHRAAKCYAYLSDVRTRYSLSRRTWKQKFKNSRWFTRSWTLQELLAPESVDFFSREWKRLGNRITLQEEIRSITGIPVEALKGTPLSKFTVKERMSWAEKREAKREEDTAYSLLGIFDVHIPLIYGEGRKNAFARLRKEIEQYPGTSFNSYDCSRQFNALGGTQMNNTGSGYQFCGSYMGPVHFG